MNLYHGSLEIVRMPEIRQSGRTLDYGAGFYTTSSMSQAEKWVNRKIQEAKTQIGYLNIYGFDTQAMLALNTLSFDSPSEEWVDFVMANRLQKDFTHYYDIVIGPVANDRVYAAFALYEGHLISKQALINELRTYRLVDQYLFHTTKSLEHLSFIEAKIITI